MAAPSALKTTALNAVHRGAGARMVDFGGWDMPVQYSGIIEEHHAVRRAVGIFDVSHMGEIEIRGPEAARLTDYVATNSVARLKIGQAHYSALLYPHGGFVDDILVHKVADNEFFLCVNASNQEKDFEHIRAYNKFDAEVDFASQRYAQIAIQGPKALATLAKLTPVDLARSSITGSRMARCAAFRRASRARATRARTASRSTWRPPRPRASGTS